jgi:solute carrier family 25 carnitine/acylcarnitine transporter 20/29
MHASRAGAEGIGMTSWACIYPLDVVKSRIQENTGNYQSISKVTLDILRREGVSAFFKGFSVAMARAFWVNGVTFAVFEMAMQYL